MTRPGWFVVVFAPALAVAVVARPSPVISRVEGTKAETAAGANPAAVVGHAVGAGGCASVGCHGAPAGGALRNGTDPTSWAAAALLWSAADPHQRAYAVLKEKLATDMMARLGGGDATTDARCLACHTNPTLAAATDPHAVQLRAEGVSCEACHGNASGWLQLHTGFTPATRAGGYDAGGMTKLYDLGERAVACAGCHVGAPVGNGLPVRDMNHDMIAAGHPRLNFDFATYQFMLPRHWYERDRTKPGTATDPTFEARSWLVGRVAHAEAACKLTADRAKRADPWPEFAESSCVACHHTIVGEKTAYPKPVGRSPGSLPWQPIWPVTRPGDDDSGKAVTALLAAMQRPRPRPEAGAAATAAAMQLEGMRRHLTGLPGADAVALVTAELGRAKAIPAGEWDRDLTEQVYHAAAALERAKMVRGEKTDAAGFAAAAKLLTLPRGTVRFDMTPGAADAVRGLK